MKKLQCLWIFFHDWGKWHSYGYTSKQRECKQCGRIRRTGIHFI